MNKTKIINDPVYGFVTLDNPLLYDIVAHPYFQRLLRIKQLGLSYMVYPGAMHSRFSHAVGAMFLMQKAVDVLRTKGVEITDDEALAVKCTILLHDIGHGPFSHSLENFIVPDVEHETISELFMRRLNAEFDGKLTTAISIFKNTYHKRFLHQLVSSQLDMDRLDYLRRDSFFTGVSEGIVGTERIINMLNVFDDNLVVEEKGIYSIEKFIISRRLMYWQVYLHKTVVAADSVLHNMLGRAKKLVRENPDFPCPEVLRFFFTNDFSEADLTENDSILDKFALLDDSDIVFAAKMWMGCDDFVLSNLSRQLINRRLPAIMISDREMDPETVSMYIDRFSKKYGVSAEESACFVSSGELHNHAYDFNDQEIEILFRNRRCVDISEASDQLDRHFLEKTVTKHYMCFPKEFRE